MQNVITQLAAANDITVTKFLDENDISVTKFLAQRANDVTVTKFLDENDISVTKFLAGAPSYNTYPGNSDVNNGGRNVNMTIIQFLEEFLYDHPEELPRDHWGNDISVTKFLQHNANVTQQLQNGQRMNIIQFLEENDISVTKFLNYLNNETDRPQNILITEFLETDFHYLQ